MNRIFSNWASRGVLFIALSYVGFFVVGWLINHIANTYDFDWFGCKNIILGGLIFGMPLGCAAAFFITRLSSRLFNWWELFIEVIASIIVSAICALVGIILADKYTGYVLIVVPMFAGIICSGIVLLESSLIRLLKRGNG